MTSYKIPVTQGIAQTFTISLSGVVYTMTLKWNNVSQVWELDVGDNAGNPLVYSIPLVTGTDLFGQYQYLGFNGKLICGTSNNPDAPPTYADLGGTGYLYFITTP